MGVDAGSSIAFGYNLDGLECPWDEYFEEHDCEFDQWYWFVHLGLKEPEYENYDQYQAEMEPIRKAHPLPFEIDNVFTMSDTSYWAIVPGSNDPEEWKPLPPITPEAIENLKNGLAQFGVKVEGEPEWMWESYFC